MIPLSGPDPAEKDVRLDHLLVETVKSACAFLGYLIDQKPAGDSPGSSEAHSMADQCNRYD